MISLESQIENINDPSTLKILLRKLINDPSSLLPTLNANKPIKKQEQSYIDHIEEEHEQTLIELDEITNQLSSLKEVYSTTNQQITTLKADVLSLKEMNQTYSIELNLLAQEKKQWSRERTELTMKLNSIPSNTQSTDTNLTIQLNKKVTDLTLQLNQLTQQIKSQSNELRIVNESLTQSQSKLEEHEDSSLKLKELQSTHDEAQEYIQLLEQQLQSQTTPLNNTFATKSLLGEIDDQRRMVESEHSRLIEEHDSLSKKHTETLTSQQRMKNHCQRLKQLQSTKTDTQSYKLLEQSLIESNVKNNTLYLETMKLQKKIDSLRETPSTLAKYSNSNQYTTFQLEGLKKESLTLKREMYAMKVLKVADDQKLRVLQGNLFDLEKRVFEMKGMNAELQFKLDEMSIDKKETTDTGGEPLRLNVVKVRSNDKVNEPSCEIDDILGSAVSSIKPLTKDKVEQEEPPKTSKVKSIHVTKKVQSECKQQ